MTCWIGIDPGATGAVAVIDDMGKISLFDCPTVCRPSDDKKIFDVSGMASLLRPYAIQESFVSLERVNAMPSRDGGNRSMGATSAFNFGGNFYCWQGILSALSMPYRLVVPLQWKKHFSLQGKRSKDASRLRAIELFPQCAHDLRLKKHHGRSEALLLAGYGKQKNFLEAK